MDVFANRDGGRNVSLTPLDADEPAEAGRGGRTFGRRKGPLRGKKKRKEGDLEFLPIDLDIGDPLTPVPIYAQSAEPLWPPSRAVCPLPLRFGVRKVPRSLGALVGTVVEPVLIQQVRIALLAVGGASVGIEAVELTGSVVEELEEGEALELEFDEGEEVVKEEEAAEEEASHAAGGGGGEEAAEEGEGFDVAEFASVMGMVATAASSSDFVRKHVKPDEYAAGLAKEAGKAAKKGGPQPSRQEKTLRKILATPLLQVDVQEAMVTIEAAEDDVLAVTEETLAESLNGLIDQVVQHVQKAVEAQAEKAELAAAAASPA